MILGFRKRSSVELSADNPASSKPTRPPPHAADQEALVSAAVAAEVPEWHSMGERVAEPESGPQSPETLAEALEDPPNAACSVQEDITDYGKVKPLHFFAAFDLGCAIDASNLAKSLPNTQLFRKTKCFTLRIPPVRATVYQSGKVSTVPGPSNASDRLFPKSRMAVFHPNCGFVVPRPL